MLSYNLYYWLPVEELRKIAESLKKGNKKVMNFVLKNEKRSIIIRFNECRISNNQIYHLFGKVINGIDEGHEAHIQYDTTKQAGTLNIYI